MNIFKKIISFVSSQGFIEENEEYNKLTSLLNIISFFTSLGAFGIFVATVFLSLDVVYMGITLLVTILYALILVFHHFHHFTFAKLYFSLVVPLWYLITMLFIGGHFSQSIAAAATIFITYLLFKKEKKLRNSLITYNIFVFILPTLYITFYEPLFGVREFPIDEIVVFLLCIGWISIVFNIYEDKTQEYIKSLERKNKELEQKTIEIQRFTDMASHDLKSPLRNIASHIGLMKRDIKKQKYDRIEEFGDIAINKVFQMNELLDGFLQISRLNRRSKQNFKMIDLHKPLKKAINNLQSDIKNKNAKIVIGDLPKMYCLESDFVIIFQNLIQNGIKYNQSEQPVIQISSIQKDNIYTIKVKDNGIGIPHQYRNQIFDFFKRLHTSEKYEGTGLGLGICKKLVNALDGTIEVRSQEKQYTEFLIKLPIKQTTQSLKISESSELLNK